MSQHVQILIVEDRDNWQSILGNELRQMGYLPHRATSRAEALAALETHRFDLAIVDPRLTDSRFNRDGMIIIQQLRERHPDLPIVIITAMKDPDFRPSFQKLCPGAPLLVKDTFDAAKFRASIRTLLGAAQINEQPPSSQRAAPMLRQQQPATPNLKINIH
jgi:DNA-binding NtrC family response regulator